MKKFILTSICAITLMLGFFIVVGAAGGLEKDLIGFTEFFWLEALGFANWGITAITSKYVEFED